MFRSSSVGLFQILCIKIQSNQRRAHALEVVEMVKLCKVKERPNEHTCIEYLSSIPPDPPSVHEAHMILCFLQNLHVRLGLWFSTFYRGC